MLAQVLGKHGLAAWVRHSPMLLPSKTSRSMRRGTLGVSPISGQLLPDPRALSHPAIEAADAASAIHGRGRMLGDERAKLEEWRCWWGQISLAARSWRRRSLRTRRLQEQGKSATRVAAIRATRQRWSGGRSMRRASCVNRRNGGPPITSKNHGQKRVSRFKAMAWSGLH